MENIDLSTVHVTSYFVSVGSHCKQKSASISLCNMPSNCSMTTAYILLTNVLLSHLKKNQLPIYKITWEFIHYCSAILEIEDPPFILTYIRVILVKPSLLPIIMNVTDF